ncbi:hypothetical protein BD413DRAFT_720511 [Trametes elegans]|nr:hypothetical protein BD413DRAFT_720511 [Trametes elegans]
MDPHMATRPNKKRKGRGNAPPRERTVTTLTDGPEGSFLASQLHDGSSPTLPAIPYPPLSAGQPPGLSAGSYPLTPFTNSFTYSFPMSSIASQPFQSQHSSPQFYSQPQPQLIPQSSPAQQLLPPGQSDLEILQRLKETIKNNQHELFRPDPQPAALASVYLGPRSAVSSHVAPHPEQVPTDTCPPGLTLLSGDTPETKLEPSASNGLISRAPPNSLSRDTAKKRSSVSESPKFNASQPPTKRANNRYDPSNNAVSTPNDSGPARYGVHTSPNMGPPGLTRVAQTVERSVPENGLRSENGSHQAASGEPSLTKLSGPNPKEEHRSRESGWTSRNSLDDRQPRRDGDKSSGRPAPDAPRPGKTYVPAVGGNDSRGLPTRNDSISEADKERERERDKERELERDRGRPPREDLDRFREDRRGDERPRIGERRPSPDSRRYEPKYPPTRRYDTKAADSSYTSPRSANKSPTETRRNLGEERAIVRPPLSATAPRPQPDERRVAVPIASDDRSARSVPSADDRRAPLPSPERPARLSDNRRPLPTQSADRSARPDERRVPPTSASVPERPAVFADDRRRPPSPSLADRLGRPVDDRRAPAPASTSLPADRSARPVDDRRPAPPVTDRHIPSPTAEDRRPSVPASGDRTARPAADDRRVPLLEQRLSRAPVRNLPDSVPPRPMLEERPVRAPQSDDRNSRPPAPLEERIGSRVPSLQERLSHPTVRSDDRPAPRLEERISRPDVPPPPSLEQRLSTPSVSDGRPPVRPQSDDRPPRSGPAPPERPVARPADERSLLAVPARAPPPVDRPAPHAQERVFTPAERFTRPATPAGSDRGHPLPARAPYRAPSVARDEPRSFRPPSPGRSPARSDVREFRPADARLPHRPGPGSDPDRYPPERRPAIAPAPASDAMDVDPIHLPRPAEGRLSYNRPSPSPVDPYPAAHDRAWIPAGEAYRDIEPARRPATDAHSYPRDWRESERQYGEDWADRSWERSREYDRDREARFVERDAVPAAWETREERERRAAYPPDVPPAPVPARAYERPLSSRLSDPYPEERAYHEHARYAPVEPPPPASYSRVRPRSPSPLRRAGGGSDDLRPPPPKRVREDVYAPPAAYYPDEPPREYAPRMRTPPPLAPPPSAAYYDERRYPASPGREREYLDARDREYAAYDRRVPPRSPPPYARAAYGRDERGRYSVPPRPRA